MSSRYLCQVLVSGFLRLHQVHLSIPTEIKALIEQFYPIYIEFQGSKLSLTDHEKECLTQYLMESLCDQHSDSMQSVLLYDGERDGLNANAFHKHCDGHQNTLTLVETNYDHIFGIFSPHRWDASHNKYLSAMGTFLCLVRSTFDSVQCPKFCPCVENGEYVTGYGPYAGRDYGPCIGFSFDVAVFTSASGNYVNHSNYTNYPDAYGNILCGGDTLDDRNKGVGIGRNGQRVHCEAPFAVRRIETFRIQKTSE